MKVSTVACCLVAGIVGGAAVWFGQTAEFAVAPAGMAYEDLIAVMLTGISILLAAISVGLAVLAFLGWTTFKGVTQKAAGTAALEHIRSEKGSDEIRKVVELKALIFLQQGLRDGSLMALAEQRNRDEDVLRQVDEDWGNVGVEEPGNG